jgi:hypothetical protein
LPRGAEVLRANLNAAVVRPNECIGSDAGVIGAATLMLHDLYAPTMGELSVAGWAS